MKILIVNFHYDLIMSNTCCAVILQKKEGYINMYGHIFYIIYIYIYIILYIIYIYIYNFVYNYILMSPRLLHTATSLFLFPVLVF